jgi:hypothetical protein
MRDGRTAATAALKTNITNGLRALADKGHDVHPEMAYHRHCRDAAQAMERGNPDGAIRHLEAGMNVLTPMSLYRHGVTDDDGHALAKLHMDAMNRHTLLIRDFKDADEHNRGVMEQRRVSRETPAQKPAGAIPAEPVPAGAQLAVVYAIAIELARRETGIELSAQTARLASVPHPLGKPGGPGLWGVEGMELPAYVQNIAHALLRTGRAKTKSQAIAIARAATKRWQRGKNTSPEVRAASSASDAQWRAKQATAHAHTAGPQQAIELYNPHQPRDAHGKWTRAPGLHGRSEHKFRYQGEPGGFGHARAMEALGDSYVPRGALKVPYSGPDAEVMRNSLYHAARAMIARQIQSARAHLAQARKSARRISPQAQADIESVARSLDDVGPAVSRRMSPQPNALMSQRGHLSSHLQTQFTAEPDPWAIINLAVRSAATLDFSQAGARPAAGQKPAASSRSQAASAEARVPAGQFGGGRFGSGGGGTKTASKPEQSAASKARQKAGLLATARSDRAKAHALSLTLAGLLRQQRAANASKAQATKAGATGKAASSTPAAKTTPAKTTGTAAAKAKAPATVPLATRIATLRTQIAQLNSAAAAAAAQAARL